MKLGNALLLIFSSIVVIIGLATAKFYDKYVKTNLFVRFFAQLILFLIVLKISLMALIPLTASIGGTLGITGVSLKSLLNAVTSVLISPTGLIGTIFVCLIMLFDKMSIKEEKDKTL